MENVIAELYAFILVKRYGSLTPALCRSILQHPDAALWSQHGFVLTETDVERMQATDSILWRIFEFLKWSIGNNYFTEYKYQIDAAARPKMYFARRESIKDMKRILVESDEMARDGTWRWKTAQQKRFIESLPDLTHGGSGEPGAGQTVMKV